MRIAMGASTAVAAHTIGAEAPCELQFRFRARRREDVGAHVFGDLDSGDADTAGRRLDEAGLPGL